MDVSIAVGSVWPPTLHSCLVIGSMRHDTQSARIQLSLPPPMRPGQIVSSSANRPADPSEPIQSNVCDVFVKIGGSVLDDATCTAQLVPYLVELSKEYRIVAMTGGGRVAKRIVGNQRRYGSDFIPSWRAGVTSLDVHAGLLASYSPSFAVGSSLFEIGARLAEGKMAVLAPAGKIVSDLVLTPDYEVTTDSMGLYFARLLGARRYVVVSDVDGIYSRIPEAGSTAALPIARLTPEELEALPSSKLDAAFPAYFRHYPLRAVVVNGKHPVRVSDALRGKPTIGTEIVLSHSEERSTPGQARTQAAKAAGSASRV